MFGLVLWLLGLLLVIVIVKAILDELELKPNIKRVVWLIVGIVVIIILLGVFSVGPSHPGFYPAQPRLP